VEGSWHNREAYSGRGFEESGMDPAYVVIRTSLRTLPRVAAPAGFESRLHRRIERLESGRAVRAWDSWVFTRGWLSAGVGVATAVVVGLLFFGPQQADSPSSVFTEGMQPTSPPLSNPFPVASSVAGMEMGERSYTGSPEREIDRDLLAGDERVDSTDHSFRPPSGHFQAVGDGHPVAGP